MRTWDVVPNSLAGSGWLFDTSSSVEGYVFANTKAEAVRLAVDLARVTATEADPISLRIHRKDGTFQEERTYPRSADPRRSKG